MNRRRWWLLLVPLAALAVGSGARGAGPPRSVRELPASATLTTVAAEREELPRSGRSARRTLGRSSDEAFVFFESAQVRPLALAEDASRLFAVNTADNRLEIFEINPAGTLRLTHSVAVGMEPVAVAVRGRNEVWVVNHLSDSVSVVRLDGEYPRVVRTLLVGDEPRDIVFAGKKGNRAFITTAHRGQNTGRDPRLQTEGRGRADVWVFDAKRLGNSLAGDPVTVLTLFGDTPRALAVTADGSTVYAAIFRSGNRTTTLPNFPFPKAPPNDSADGVPAPESGLIVQFDGRNWVDELAQVWNQRVGFDLPDLDVFEIDAEASLPRVRRSFSGVGTTLFNMAVNPATGALYVANQEARNQVRFSGRGERGGTTVRGHIVDDRITVVRNGLVTPRELNTHIDFSTEATAESERGLSLSLPQGMQVSEAGDRLYLAAMGSNRIAAIDTADLEAGHYRPSSATQARVPGGGPTGLVLDSSRGLLFVLARYKNSIVTFDSETLALVDKTKLFNPEPRKVARGRKFLYDATLTSGRGNASCASCHLFGDNDALAWDLGNPDATTQPNPNAFGAGTETTPRVFHPMKGPMTTQSMRGLAGHGPMHWRGDRTGASRRPGQTLEEAAFEEFNEAFDSLQGGEELSRKQMRLFSAFAMRLSYPPNPIRNLDNSLTPGQEAGRRMFLGNSGNPDLEVCVSCHVTDREAGIFGTSRLTTDNGQTGERAFKVPHFRDQYQKIGSFGPSIQDPGRLGAQVRGFGFNHNGATNTAATLAELPLSRQERSDLRSFLYVFESRLAPIVGQQITLTSKRPKRAERRIGLLIARSRAGECDLIVKGTTAAGPKGWLRQADGTFLSSEPGEGTWELGELLDLGRQPERELTFTCVPPGSGLRLGIDRDGDGIADGDDPRLG